MLHTHVTAPTEYVTAGGIQFAYRRFGKESGVPLLFMQHLRGGMDHWDPSVTDGLAADRPVILFDGAGVAGSSGETPSTFAAMAAHATNFVEAIGVTQLDLLGFSLGGYMAQAFVLQNPRLVRKLILAGTGPRAGEPSTDPNVMVHATRPENTQEDFLYLFFALTANSQTAGRAFWERRHLRKQDVDPDSTQQTLQAQLAATAEWRQPLGERFSELKKIQQPTLVVNGHHDVMIPTINAYHLSQHLPNAQLIIYPDSGHGSLFQYPALFVHHAKLFLDA